MTERPTQGETLIEFLTSLPAHRWRQICYRMMWVYRLERFDAKYVPQEIYGHLHVLNSAETWHLMRRLVNKSRRNEHTRKLRERKRAQEEQRREYMRVYMRQRRAK